MISTFEESKKVKNRRLASSRRALNGFSLTHLAFKPLDRSPSEVGLGVQQGVVGHGADRLLRKRKKKL
jgi:hypothetical protein